MTEKTKKIDEIIKQVEGLSVLELNQLVKSLEEKFDIKAGSMMAAAPAGGAPAAGAGADQGQDDEKAIVNLILTAAGDQKISVIKAVRQVKPDLGLKEAKDLVEKAPQELLKEVDRKEAEEAKKKLEEAGATVELK